MKPEPTDLTVYTVVLPITQRIDGAIKTTQEVFYLSLSPTLLAKHLCLAAYHSPRHNSTIAHGIVTCTHVPTLLPSCERTRP